MEGEMDDAEMISAADELLAELDESGTPGSQRARSQSVNENYGLEVDADPGSRQGSSKPRPPPKAKGSSSATTSKPKPKPRPKARTTKPAKSSAKSRPTQLKTSQPPSRPRSVSEVHVAPSDDTKEEILHLEPEVVEEEDTKLYCVCQTRYDEETVMIACDKCDDWYHPPCVELKEQDVELVDLFFCPRCVQGDPSLHTSYKPACARDTCTHPARPPLSRYCSEDCGVRAVMARIDAWKGSADRLLDNPTVKHARKREGVVLLEGVSHSGTKSVALRPHLGNPDDQDHKQREVLQKALQRISADRDAKIEQIAALQARLTLLKIAEVRVQRLGNPDLCGYDRRLFMDERAWQTWASGSGRALLEQFQDDDRVENGGGEGPSIDMDDGDFYCGNKRKCDRHAGWQKLKLADFELEKGVNEQALEMSTTRERALRRRLEDLDTYLEGRTQLENKRRVKAVGLARPT